jgi:hypothetical protein
MCQDVAQFLTANADSIRNAPVDSPEYRALEMVLASGSAHVQRILLGPAFPVWMSLGPPRPDLVRLMITYVAMDIPARMLIRGISTLDTPTVSQLTPSVISYLCAILQYCYDHAREKGLRMQGSPFLHLFEIASTTTEVIIAPLLIPIAKIVRSSDVIWDFDDFDFQLDLRRITGKLCTQTASGEEVTLYPLRIQALAILAANEETCLSMIQDNTFAVRVLALLSSPELTLLRKTWLFFDELARFPRTVSQLVMKGPKLITAILNTDNNWVMRKFLDFSIHVWVDLGPGAGKLFCQALIGGVGRISCIYKTRRVLFKDDESLVQLVERYYETLTQLEIPGTEDFLSAVARHISAGATQSKPRAATKRG